MATKNRIGLRIPEQSPPMGQAFYLNEKGVSEWSERLPVASIGETSRQLFQALREFNRTQIPYKKRLMSAEKFREPVNYVGSSLSKHFVDVGFPLTDKAHKIANLNRELNSGLATAYKCMVVDILLEQYGKPDRKLLTIAIHRAISYLSQVMLLSVLVYDSYPKRTWRELHVLHRLAYRYNLESTLVKDPLDEQGRSTTIDQAYCRCVLFSLASPYKMRQRENIQVYDALLDWSRHAHFYGFDRAPAETTIITRQDSDKTPSHQSLTEDASSRHLMKMDASELIEILRQQFDDQANSETLQGVKALDKNLLRQLIQLWSTAQKRTFVRTKLNFELRIAVGLNNIHQLIEVSAAEMREPLDQSRDGDATWIDKKFAEGNVLEISSKFTLQPIDSHRHVEPRHADFEDFGPISQGLNEPDPATSIWDRSNRTSGMENTHIFHTLNESAGGYCLDWKGTHKPKVLVGELIGIQSAMSSNQFGIGLVRWMKSNPHESMQVGLQMIAPNAMAVTARQGAAQHRGGQKPSDTGHREQPAGAVSPRAGQADLLQYKCLLLPEVGTSGQPTSFVCPSFPFSVGDMLTIDSGQSTREVKLTRLLESSGTISQFQFIYLDQPEQRDEDDDQGSESDFDSLWSTL